MKEKRKRNNKKRAQGVFEFVISFAFIFFGFFFMMGFALYWYNIYCVHTFNDEVASNLSLMEGNRACSFNDDVIKQIEIRAGRYLQRVKLRYTKFGDNEANLVSDETVSGEYILNFNIQCESNLNGGITTAASYFYKGIALHSRGVMIKSVSSTHSPRF